MLEPSSEVPIRSFGLLSCGALAGVLAALGQLEMLGSGMLAGTQRQLVFAGFGLLGIALALVGGALARSREGAVFYGTALLVPLAGFAALLPLNLRGQPDVYLLVTDATRADHLSLYGYERRTTPFLEELAARSVVFTNSVSQGSHTIVTTPCLLASRYPSEHGVTRYSHVLPARFTLLPEYLKAAGYRTYGYATNPHLAPDRGYRRGFDVYEHDRRWRYTPAGEVNRRFLRWLDAQDGGPVFAFLFYIDPHSPYAPPPEFARLFHPEGEEPPIQEWRQEWGVPAPESARLRSLVAQYDGAIAYWDAELRRLLSALDARGKLDNSVLIYTSDHGEEFFEHGNWGHNRTLFEESIGVPLLISIPAPLHFPPLPRVSGRVDEVVSSVDVLPTLLDYLKLEPEPGVRGRSALPLLLAADDPGPERLAYCEEILESYGPYDVRAIRSRDHKYVRILDYEGDRTIRDLFFDLRADPGERSDRLESEGDGEGDRARLHRALLERMMARMAGVRPPEGEAVPLEPEVLERLRALGYVGD